MFINFLILMGIVLFAWYLSRNKNDPSNIDRALSQRNREWYSYISSFRLKAKTKDQKKLIDEMLVDIKKQGLVDDVSAVTAEDDQASASNSINQATQKVYLATEPTDQNPSAIESITSQPVKPSIELDNASLLLYFGAFLFVASTSLFVAFSGAGGILKAIAVYVVAMALYVTGCWLYKNKKQFRQVGIAFAGIGMSILPLMGLAIYKYVLNSQNGSIAWVVTSFLSLVVFGHAVWYFRKPFLNYVLIFTSLSLFESAISVVDAPIYYFGWAMAVLSLVLLAVSLYKNIWLDFRESALYSSQIMLPISIVLSLIFIQKSGVIQLGISLSISCLYYFLQAYSSKDQNRDAYSAITQVLAISSISTFVYAVEPSWHLLSIVALSINFVQLLIFLVFSRKSDFWFGWSGILQIYASIGVAMAIGSANLVILSLAFFVASSYLIWLKSKQNSFYIIGVISLTLFAFVFGQYYLASTITYVSQSALLAFVLTVQLAIYMIGKKIATTPEWNKLAMFLLAGSALFTAMFSIDIEGLWLFAICYYTALIIGILSFIEKDNKWTMLVGGVVVLPVIGAYLHMHYLAVAVVIALFVNIILAIKYRYEFNRWLGSLLWFIMPMALGRDLFIGSFTALDYSLAYLVILVGFLLSRSIARGAILVSAKVPISAYGKSASLSYVFGYGLSAIVSTILATTILSPSWFLPIVLLVCILATYIVAVYIEKQYEILLLLPFLIQFTLWAILRPFINEQGTMLIFGVVSTIVAGIGYMLAYDYLPKSKNWAQLLTVSTLATVYITPFTIVFSQSTWVMPVGLFVATVCTYTYFKDTNQNNRELIAMIGLGSIYWLMWYLGIREVQAYSHLMVAVFAVFAYWRYSRQEVEQSNNYIYILLAVATIPLIIQAVIGQAGGLYGWWLILEQIMFIIIGMSIRNGVMIRWGLYVAVGAVLYQLRHLGWVALTLLAVFVIGLAIYKIQHSNKS